MKALNFKNKTLIALCLGITLIYQNCDNPNLSHLGKVAPKAQSCNDLKNLTIIESSNLGVSSVSKEFALYFLNDSGTWERFTPEDSSSQWPPLWKKDGVNAVASELLENGTVFSTRIEETPGFCTNHKIEAFVNLCGEEHVVEKTIGNGTNCQTSCLDSSTGISAQVGEIRDFYKSELVSCDETCEKIQRECLPTGQFGPALENPTLDITQYQEVSCSQEECIDDGGPGDPVDPAENISCPAIPGGVKSWSARHGHMFPLPYQGQRDNAFTVSGASPQANSSFRIVPTISNGTQKEIASLVYSSFDMGYGAGGMIYSSISKCPHDFGVDQKAYFPMGKCLDSSGQVGISFIIVKPGGEDNLSDFEKSRFCILTEGKTYYFNATAYDGHTDTSTTPATPLTPGASCPLSSCTYYGGAQAR